MYTVYRSWSITKSRRFTFISKIGSYTCKIGAIRRANIFIRDYLDILTLYSTYPVYDKLYINKQEYINLIDTYSISKKYCCHLI